MRVQPPDAEPVTQRYHLVGHDLCPYVQRVAIVLVEKKVDFRRTDIDLFDKPAWFLAHSPTGRVPLLIVDDQLVLFESHAICEYIDETSVGTLQSPNSVERARHRALIAQAEAMLGEVARFIYGGPKQSSRCAASLLECLRVVEPLVAQRRYCAPFYLVDAAYATVFRYFRVLEGLLGVAPLGDSVRLLRWSRDLSERPSVVAAVPADYDARLLAFIERQWSRAAATG